MRPDHLAHIPENEMTLEQLISRRNGRQRDIEKSRGDRAATLKAQQDLANCLRLIDAKRRETPKDGV